MFFGSLSAWRIRQICIVETDFAHRFAGTPTPSPPPQSRRRGFPPRLRSLGARRKSSLPAKPEEGFPVSLSLAKL